MAGISYVSLLVYRGQVVTVDQELSGPLPADQAADLINQRRRPQGQGAVLTKFTIVASWDHGSELWEYSYRDASNCGYALIREGRIFHLAEHLASDQCPPPHTP